MKIVLRFSIIALLFFSISGLPIIEIRSADTDGGPITNLKLLALPILREVTLPEATFYYVTSQGCPQQHATQTTAPPEQTTTGDNAEVKKPGDNATGNEIPAFTFYV